MVENRSRSLREFSDSSMEQFTRSPVQHSTRKSSTVAGNNATQSSFKALWPLMASLCTSLGHTWLSTMTCGCSTDCIFRKNWTDTLAWSMAYVYMVMLDTKDKSHGSILQHGIQITMLTWHKWTIACQHVRSLLNGVIDVYQSKPYVFRHIYNVF